MSKPYDRAKQNAPWMAERRRFVLAWVWQWAALTMFAMAVDSGQAHAYVRTLSTEQKVPLAWRRSCVELEIVVGSGASTFDQALLRHAAAQAADGWSRGQVTCTNMILSVRETEETSAFVTADRVNTVQFRNDFWGRNAPNKEDAVPYERRALAITSVFANRNTGEIYDTDVEINATTPLWGDVIQSPELLKATNAHDLQNTLTHEFGHVIGLDHTCDAGGQSNFFDHRNIAVPPCPGTPTIQETTMAGIVVAGDTLRRTLDQDDKLGLCDIYPKDAKRKCGAARDGGGCRYGGHERPTNFIVVVALVSLTFVVLQRKRPPA